MIPIITIIKRLLSSNKISFIITIFVVLCATTSGDIALSNGNYTWLLAILTPFFFVFYDFKKLIYLGSSKLDYFIGVIISYILLSFLISFTNTIIHLLIDPIYNSNVVINLIDVCGWSQNGLFIGSLQQMCFLLLFMIFLHVLLSVQYYWYGWLIDILIIAVISIFTPIPSLRNILSNFFKIIMFNSNAITHIITCVLLSIIVSFLGLIVLKTKKL